MMKRILSILLVSITCMSLAVTALAYTHDELTIKDNLPYDYVSELSEGFALVCKGGKWGLIDAKQSDRVK